MATDTAFISSLNISLQSIEENLDRFITYDKKHSATILSVLRDVFNYSKKDEAICGRKIQGCPFEHLQLDPTNFDNEVIWQQIQLQNESLLARIRTGFKHLHKKENFVQLHDLKSTVIEKNQDEFEDRSDHSDVIEESSSNEVDFDEEGIDESKEISKPIQKSLKPKGTSKAKGSVVDDQFFKLAEMEKFLEGNHDRDEMSGSDEDENIDYFMDFNRENDILNDRNDGDAKSAMYSDYFEAPDELRGKLGAREGSDVDCDEESMDYEERDNASEELDTPDDEETPKSMLEKQQEKVKKQIAALEESNVAAKSWQLTGETSASARPSNSLLQEVLQFDHTSAAAPVITEETSKSLEEIIIQRIKDGAWDDVERKEKPVKEAYKYKKAKPIDQEKSKMSLSEIYEKEYLQQQNPVVEKESEEHVAIKKLMKSLFFKLDALSNFHFTPKPLKSEVTIVSNVPSVTIEECAPVNVSETALLAPEEVYDKHKTAVKGQGEMTKQDRTRQRRIKKRRQRSAVREKAKVDKILEKTGLGNKYSKARAMEKLKKDSSSTVVAEKSRDSSLTTSSGFFTKLQDSVREDINKKTHSGKKEKNKTSSAQCRL